VRKHSLRLLALFYLLAILVGPLTIVFYRTFEHGVSPAWHALSSPETIHAFKLTLIITAIAVPLNTIFGVGCAILLVRHRWRGNVVLDSVINLPFAISPVVIGLALFLLYGRDGWLDSLPFQVLFSLPAMVLATMFVSLPFVVREVVPVLREIGTDQEQAAATLGAGPIATFRRVTLPAIRPGVVAAALFGFVTSFGNLEMSLFLVGAGRTTLPIAILQYLEWKIDPTVAAVSVMQIALIGAAMIVTDRYVKIAHVV